jgi:hypothetical protein
VAVIAATVEIVTVEIVTVAVAVVIVAEASVPARRVPVAGVDRLRLAPGGHGRALRARDRVHHASRAHRRLRRRLPAARLL